MIIVKAVFLFFVFTSAVWATENNVIPIFGGYYDVLEKKFVVPPIYDATGYFSENGLAFVNSGGKWGYVDKQGKVVVSLVYDEARDFSTSGLAPVKKNGKWGYINELGKEVISPVFQNASVFNKYGLATVRKGDSFGLIDTSGTEVLPIKHSSIPTFFDNGVLYFERENLFFDVKSLKRIWTNSIGRYANNELFIVEKYSMRTGDQLVKKGFANINGEIVIPMLYENAQPFKNNLAAVKKDGKYGYINPNGLVVIPFQFDDAGSFNSYQISEVTKNGKKGFINNKGDIVFYFSGLNGVDFFNGNGLARASKNGKFGFITHTGEVAIPFEYDKADIAFENSGLVLVKKGPRSGYLDKFGKWIVYFEFVCDAPVVKNGDNQTVWSKEKGKSC